MKSIGFTHSLAVDEAQSLFEFDVPDPVAKGRDLLIDVKAVSVNPADAKRRIRTAVDTPHETPLVLGYDAAGVVAAVGSDVTNFAVGDEVWYAGDANRPGSNSQRQLVDERVTGRKPSNLSWAEAAAMPLTGLTSFEMLFDRFGIVEGSGKGKSLLVIGGAGGVGSLTIQMAAKLTELTVIATASRPETAEWCREMGAHEIVDHRDLIAEVQGKGFETVEYIANYADTSQHWDAMATLVAPQGKLGCIVETDDLIDVTRLQGKSASLHWELMFTRSLFGTDDMARQHDILNRIADLVESGDMRSTLRQTLNGFSADVLKDGHRIIETGQVFGKLVIEY
jgi:NADPH:quinone reductase